MPNSRLPSVFPFNADLTDCLLRALPDFQSLQAFISSSKFVYSVFRSRQNSILGTVAQSHFGPALPPAIHLVSHLSGTRSSGLTRGLHLEADSGQDLLIAPSQVRLLRDHAATVRTLEDIYSWREKDPRSRSSRLSTIESLRFQQSVYRFWSLTAAYGPGALVNERLACRNDNFSKLKDSIIGEQVTFLLSLGEVGLSGVDEVHRFLLDLAKWASVKHTPRPMQNRDRDEFYLVWSGPSVTLDAFRGKWPSFRPIDLQWCSIWRAMTHAFFSSEITSVTGGQASLSTRRRFILDDYFLKTIDCSRCGVPPSSRDSLWSFCNWEYMALIITPSRLGSFLSSEKRKPLAFLVSFTEAIESISYPQFIEEVLNIRSAQYSDWEKDDWLCTRCMTKLLSDSIQTWLEKKTEAVSTNTELLMAQ